MGKFSLSIISVWYIFARGRSPREAGRRARPAGARGGARIRRRRVRLTGTIRRWPRGQMRRWLLRHDPELMDRTGGGRGVVYRAMVPLDRRATQDHILHGDRRDFGNKIGLLPIKLVVHEPDPVKCLLTCKVRPPAAPTPRNKPCLAGTNRMIVPIL